MQDWESLIAERTEAHGTVVTCLVEDPVKRNRALYEKSPRRIAMHKAWEQSPAGKKSRSETYKRYAATENGKAVRKRCKRAYFLRHKDDPEWREHRREVKRAWYARKQEDKLNGNTNPTP